MNGRTLILLVVAIVIAVVTVVVVKNRTQVVQTGPKVLVATTQIDVGSFVRADKQLAWVDWPKGGDTSSFITSATHKMEDFNGGVARRTILTGEPITDRAIVRPNEGGFMPSVLKPGERAVSIAVSPTSGNAGFIFPGDKVDLILTHKIPGGMLASETFIEDIRVLAIDQMLDNPENKAMIAKTITLEVSPKQAEMINVAESLGTISVILRSLANAAGDAPATVKTTPTEPRIGGDNYSTDSDVSKFMDNKGSGHAKVSVYHGTQAEQLDFHQQGQK